MKDTYYFPHDYNARGDEKIINLFRAHGLEGYGVYWVLIEKLYESGGRISADFDAIAYDLRTKSEFVKSVATKFGLFYLTSSSTLLASKSVDRRLRERRERQEIARQHGIAGAEAKRKKQATLKPPLSHPQGSGELERKGKERKEIKPTDSGLKDKIERENDLLQMRMPWGDRFKGVHIINIDPEYCAWVLSDQNPKRSTVGKELEAALRLRIKLKQDEKVGMTPLAREP